MLEVHFRGGFSDRNGLQKESTEMQLDKFDDRTKTALVNTARLMYELHNTASDYKQLQNLLRWTLADVYLQEIRWDCNYNKQAMEAICDTIWDDTYDAVLTVIEYFANKIDSHFNDTRLTASYMFNGVFEKEYVGYRFVDNIIAPITNPIEIEAIEEAVASPYREVNSHIEKSIKFLSDRESPDYKNSIKESITAVERLCTIIIGDPKATLGIALKKLESSGLQIHPSMKIAFDKLYGYTSDSSGIRHAGELGGPDSTFEEAKFMLVSCSAFMNYLIGAMAKNP